MDRPPMEQPRVAALCGLGVPAERLERLSAALRLPLWRPGDYPDDSPSDSADPTRAAATVLALLDGLDTAEAAESWARPIAAWIEVGTLSDEALAAAAGRARRADLFAFLTTATANHVHLAARIVRAITDLHPLPDTQRDDMELALHEAVSNALVHGNLQVEGMKGLSVAALERFSQDLAARMADPLFANRRIEVAVWLDADGILVEVADEGTGYARPEHMEFGASGRGLDMIAAIAEELQLLDGGRRIRMRFPL
ncbi:ATP-binding protein [Azospirillum rugosum]|uniref:Anti-sigma regulatory factor (Ser/Thr protein kinase) n=1 Tax=Azospirillum rugosum TaxID=416170 RepID=A0ABS4SK06_9PROT|nr:ATP-binding protein [Azospirillum rugosum]MBP2292418.1 anti-sigma regulatory factor (Ser/Thr protein kinase) [Azospirillum rugosum]MDQ0526177.1 anti-sigma regulatory factor (Ser/Thr protein kinase) [Azospirillum rugosum]